MIRSRVSFATGWMSEGSGPAVCHAGPIIRAAPEGIAQPGDAGVGSRGDAVRQHRAAAPRDRSPHPRAALHGRVLGRHAAARDRRRRARPSACARRAPPPTRCARPGQLGLGRAYVSGELEVDDMDAVIELLDSWQPPPLDGADKRALLLGAVRAAGLTPPPPRPGGRAAPERPPPQQGARRPRRPPPLRRLQRVLRALPRRLDDLQLRDLLARARRRSRRRRRRSSRRSAASWR